MYGTRNVALSAGSQNPTNWVRETSLDELKDAIFEARREIEAREFDIHQNASQDLLSNIILGGMMICSLVGGIIYASKHYLLDKLRRNEARIEQRRSIPLGHYAA